MTELKNYMEALVLDFIPKYLAEKENACGCDRCQADIAALALNELPPKYIVTVKGELYTQISQLQRQYEADIMMAVMKAQELVSKNPRHPSRVVNPKKF